MTVTHPLMTRAIAQQPIHSVLFQFPIVCFTLVLLTDVAYWRTANLMWQNFSSWLLLAGLLFGASAALAAFIDFLFRSDVRRPRPAWPYLAGGLLVLALGFLNALVHASDGWTAVMPWGLILSAVTVIVILASGWFSRAIELRYAEGEHYD